MKKVGILGAGQLGCMLAESLFKFGAEVSFYDTQPNAPGSHRTPHFTCGEWNDSNKLHSFFTSCDVVTYEFENVSISLLDTLVSQTKVPLYPSAHVLAITQNRIHEKNFLLNNSLPVCQFTPILTLDDLKKINGKGILKTATGGYDGKGQWKINNPGNIQDLLHKIGEQELNENNILPLIFEELVPIAKEVSCITARNKHGQIVCFPIFENIHKDHILYQTLLPADISPVLEQQVQEIARQATEKLEVVGLLTTEFFITVDGKIFVNEFAPRPHNSGHISHAACSISQFDMHARILLDLPIHTPVLHDKFYCMENILGDVYIKQGHTKNLNLNAWKNNPDVVDVRLYGKDKAEEKRKMGHFIAMQKTRTDVIKAAEKFKKELYESK